MNDNNRGSNMDFFGIGNGVAAVARVFFLASRNTGRTNALRAALTDGDRVVYARRSEFRDDERWAKERGLKVEFTVLDPSNLDISRLQGRSHHRTYFDHRWLQDYYTAKIERAAKDVDDLQDMLSSIGASSLANKRASQSVTANLIMAKW